MGELRVIGLTGPKGSGKDAAADVLVQRFGWVKINPGDPIRAMVKALLRHEGYEDDALADLVDGRNRDETVLHIEGVDITPRRLMQTLGDDWGRGLIHPDLYACMMFTSARQVLEAGVPGVAISGVRKANEAAIIRDNLDGEVWNIERPGVSYTAEHTSEMRDAVMMTDRTIANDADLLHLADAVTREFLAAGGNVLPAVDRDELDALHEASLSASLHTIDRRPGVVVSSDAGSARPWARPAHAGKDHALTYEILWPPGTAFALICAGVIAFAVLQLWRVW